MLTPLHLNFVYRRRIAWAGIVLLALALLFAGYTAYRWATLTDANRRLGSQIAEAERHRRAEQTPVRSAQAERDARERTQAERRLTDTLNYPWPQVLAEVEAAAIPDSIALLSLDHDASVGQTRLKVRARDLPALLAYVKNLNSGKDRGPWSISEHRPASGGEPGGIQGQLFRMPVHSP